MRSLVHAFVAALLLAFAPLAAAPALAQAGAVMVVDSQTILSQSAAGRDMNQRLQTIANQMQAEIQPEQTWLQGEEQALGQATQNQTPDQIRANTQLAQRIEAYNRRFDTFRQRQVTLTRDLQFTRQQAIREFNNAITPVVNEVMAARGAQIVVDRGSILHRADSADATQDVLTRLDQRVQTINVTRQTAPPQQAQN